MRSKPTLPRWLQSEMLSFAGAGQNEQPASQQLWPWHLLNAYGLEWIRGI